MSMNGIKKSKTPAIKATEAGTLVPNTPVAFALLYIGGGVGWLLSIKDKIEG